MTTARRETLDRKYKAIKAEYEAMRKIKEFNKQKFTTSYIISSLAHKFFLSDRTIESIVWTK